MNLINFRLKTGTPSRIRGDSIDYDKCIIQNGDETQNHFLFLQKNLNVKQVPCFITHTNEKTHSIILNNIHNSPMYDGSIKSKGPRYCPSIEDKVKRFEDRKRHQIFLEPETEELVQLSILTVFQLHCLKVQIEFLKTINGLERVEVDKFGYAVEYDCIDSSELKSTYETKKIK